MTNWKICHNLSPWKVAESGTELLLMFSENTGKKQDLLPKKNKTPHLLSLSKPKIC